MGEKRVTQRMRSLKGARIVLANNISTFHCTVRNLSKVGACLELPSTVGLTDEFQLIFDDGAAPRSCKVKWKSATRIGVELK